MTDDLERRMREAFDGAHLPAGLAERTLARIEAERAAQEAQVMGRLRAGLAAGAGLILAIVLY